MPKIPITLRAMAFQKHTFIAEEKDLQLRLDKVLVQHFSDYTRHFLQKLFKEKMIHVNGKVAKPSIFLQLGQKVELAVPAPRALDLEAKAIPLDIIFENKDLMVINKAAGLVTHPGVGDSHIDDSLVNAVLFHCRGQLSGISGVMRPGIVHRLDKDTSGLILVAKNDKAHQSLADQLKNHQIEKTYYALLAGHLQPIKGSIEAPIGRSELNRKKMAVVDPAKGKEALTHYRVLEYFNKIHEKDKEYSFVEVQLVTGRTHQIRVHFSSIDFPLVGDPLYGRERLNTFFDQRFEFRRQFLHAGKITFCLPGSQKRVTFEATLPDDLKQILEWMKET